MFCYICYILLLYIPWWNEDIDLLYVQTSYVNAFKVHIKTVQQKLHEHKPLAQIIDIVVDELQHINEDTDMAVSIHDGNIAETMEIPHPGKCDN